MKTEIEHPDGTKLVPFEGGWKVETILEKNKWYKCKEHGNLVYYCSDESLNYGFCFGMSNPEWSNALCLNLDYTWLPASEEEVKDALMEEAKRRGYKNGVRYMCYDMVQEIENMDGMNYYAYGILTDGYGGHIYDNGEWSEICKPNEKILERIANIEKELEQLKGELK